MMSRSNGKRPSPNSSLDCMESPRISQDDLPQGIASQLLDMIRRRHKLQRRSEDFSCVPPEFGISFPAPVKRKERNLSANSNGYSMPSFNYFPNDPTSQQQGDLNDLIVRLRHNYVEFNDNPSDNNLTFPSCSLTLPDEKSVMGSTESNATSPANEFECNAPYQNKTQDGEFIQPYYNEGNGSFAFHNNVSFANEPTDVVDLINPESKHFDVEVDQLFSELETFLPNITSQALESSPPPSKFDNSWPLPQDRNDSSPNTDVQNTAFQDPFQSNEEANVGKTVETVLKFSNSQLSPSSSNLNPDLCSNQNDPLISTDSKGIDCSSIFVPNAHILHQSPSNLKTNGNNVNVNNMCENEEEIFRSNTILDAIQPMGMLNAFGSDTVYGINSSVNHPSRLSSFQQTMVLNNHKERNLRDISTFNQTSVSNMDTVQSRNSDPNSFVSRYSYRNSDFGKEASMPFYQSMPLPPSNKMNANNLDEFSHARNPTTQLLSNQNAVMNTARFSHGINPSLYTGSPLHLNSVCAFGNVFTPEAITKTNVNSQHAGKDLYSRFQTQEKSIDYPHSHSYSPFHSPSPSHSKKENSHIPFCFASRPVFNQLENLLFLCADSIDRGDLSSSHQIMQALNAMVSPHGSAMQRMAYYFLEGLAARIIGTGSAIYQALQSRNGSSSEPANKELMKALLAFLEACPYVPFAHMAANNSIFEAVEGCDRIHIIDFGITHGTQWPTLIEMLAKRSKGPPHLRISGVDAPQTGLKPSSIQETGRRLSSFAKLVGVPFEFSSVTEHIEDLRAEQFEIREGEVLAVNCVLRLHQIFHECNELKGKSPRNHTLQMIRDLSPKIVTLVEQHTNHNHPSFKTRFKEAISYFTPMFDSVEAAFEWNSSERVLLEERVCGRKIINIVACEGKERIERHEPHDQWHSRMINAGFKPMAFSADVIDSLHSLLKRHTEGYGLDLSDHSVMLTWRKKKMIAASTWGIEN